MLKSKFIYIHLDNQMSLNLQSLHKAQLSDKTRFADGLGTNPEEIIGTAHAGCFSMQVGFLLNEAGFTAENIDINAKVVFEDGTITKIDLELTATIPEISEEKFQETALAAKAKYQIFRLSNTEISLTATLA
jgi:osmotically inducible protein OsmC